MKSVFFEGRLLHRRLKPVRHEFEYPIFQFGIELDELPQLRALWLFRLKIFSIRDSDYLERGPERSSVSLKEKLSAYLRERHGLTAPVGRALLVTQARMFGYAFNPVSFFFCYDSAGHPLAVLAEVNNTFGESKTYLVQSAAGEIAVQPKDFYISPFVALDARLKMSLPFPNGELRLHIQSEENGSPVLIAGLTGRAVPLTGRRLLRNCIKFPLAGLVTILRIHWHALMLYFRKVPYHAKESYPLQAKNAYRKDS
ncbi:MAG: DUF1365 domain-containing protein [Bdellovibrionia bacterium]